MAEDREYTYRRFRILTQRTEGIYVVGRTGVVAVLVHEEPIDKVVASFQPYPPDLIEIDYPAALAYHRMIFVDEKAVPSEAKYEPKVRV